MVSQRHCHIFPPTDPTLGDTLSTTCRQPSFLLVSLCWQLGIGYLSRSLRGRCIARHKWNGWSIGPHSTRITILKSCDFGWVVIDGRSISSIGIYKQLDGENQSLLSSSASPASSIGQNRRPYQSIVADSESAGFHENDDTISEDSGSEEGFFSDKQQRHLKRDGGWISYVKEYKIFWPYIWPSRYPKFRLFFWILGANVLAERALRRPLSQTVWYRH